MTLRFAGILSVRECFCGVMLFLVGLVVRVAGWIWCWCFCFGVACWAHVGALALGLFI